ncbi:hypothetical protein WN982_28120 [Paraburkholderia sp. IMGN_8]
MNGSCKKTVKRLLKRARTGVCVSVRVAGADHVAMRKMIYFVT